MKHKMLPLSFQESYKKAVEYCSRSEHCRSQIIVKLRQWNADPSHFEDILEKLEQDNFLNEARYAELFVRSKVRQNQWGRYKIIQALRYDRVNESSIKSGMDALDESLYRETLQAVLQKAEKSIKETNQIMKKRKIIAYAVSKGFEQDLISDLYNEMRP